MIVIRDPKPFYFNFDLPEDIDETLKGEIEFIIKSNESVAEITIKSEIQELLLKYKHENNIHEHVKQQLNAPDGLFLTCHKDKLKREKCKNNKIKQ